MARTSKRTVAIGLVGSTLDAGLGPKRWDKWRPTIGLVAQEDLGIDRLELLHQPRHEELARKLADDVAEVSDAEVRLHPIPIEDPWDLEEVFGALYDFARSSRFDAEREEYLVHITTGSHVQQICLFLLTESRHFPARLVQTSPPSKARSEGPHGSASIIDLDLARFEKIAQRFAVERTEARTFLKSGIATRSATFDSMIERIEVVAARSRDPILLEGPTGAGKSQLAARVFELKKHRQALKGAFVEVNCATLRGDLAMSALFGHSKGSFTGASDKREGLLRRADGGVLFLDEIGELGRDEQAMLLRAIEDKTFLPLGSDREVRSDFQLVCGTNRDLAARVAEGVFREDLLARIDLWTFRLPALAERREDIAPNLDYELESVSARLGRRVSMSKESRARFLAFAESSRAAWPGNFRDLNAAVVRMATLAEGGRIDAHDVDEEIARLESSWSRTPSRSVRRDHVVAVLGEDGAAALDRFDRAQLEEVLATCAASRSLSEAGRALFAQSRKQKTSVNDADRLRKYLARFGLDWESARVTRS